MKKIKVLKLEDLKKGQVIESICEQVSVSEAGRRFMHRQESKGKITKIDKEKQEVHVELPNGTIEIIQWVNFIIYIIPKLQAIWFLLKGWWENRK